MESFRIIADHVIKTERQIVVPRVETVVKQKPNPMVNEKKKRFIFQRIRKRKQKKGVVQETHTASTGTMPGRTFQSKWEGRLRKREAGIVPKKSSQTKKANGNPPKATPKTKKATKYRYDCLRLIPRGDSLQVIARRTDGGRLIRAVDLKSVDNHEETVESVVKILKTSEIDTFELSELGPSLKLLKYWPQIKKCAPFRFKTVKSSETSINLLKFLKNCEGVENILLNTSSCNGQAMVQLFSLPAVINCKVLQVTSNHADFVYSLAKKWAGLDVKVPNRNPGFPSSRHAIPFIASKFGKRVIYEKVNETRIRTNDESMHILIRRNKDYSLGSLFSCTLIPSNLLESECEKATWFKELTALGSAYEDFTEFE